MAKKDSSSEPVNQASNSEVKPGPELVMSTVASPTVDESAVQPEEAVLGFTPGEVEQIVFDAIKSDRESEAAGLAMEYEGEEVSFYVGPRKIISLKNTFRPKGRFSAAEIKAQTRNHIYASDDFKKAASAYTSGFRVLAVTPRDELIFAVVTDDAMKYKVKLDYVTRKGEVVG